MVRRINGRSSWLMALAAVFSFAVAVPAFAQSGMIRGTVKDAKGDPVEGAKITIESAGGGRRYEVRSDRKGEFLQIGLNSGQWAVYAEKDKMASNPVMVATQGRAQATANLVLGVLSAAGAAEAAANNAQLKKFFDEGVALSGAGKHNEAIEKFNAGLAVNDKCSECYDSIGASYAAMKDLDKAEAAYKKSIEVRPDVAGGYAGLAQIYNAQRKFDLANEASANAMKYAGAGTGGGADSLYSQAVILFNQGKTTEAKPLLEQAIAANPNHSDSHYLLGMTLAGLDPPKAVAEFETYLKLAPDGPADKVKMANDLIAALKQ